MEIPHVFPVLILALLLASTYASAHPTSLEGIQKKSLYLHLTLLL